MKSRLDQYLVISETAASFTKAVCVCISKLLPYLYLGYM
jgi:hypothetical protein